ncbi:MAG: hypothetical protein ACOC80_07125 [Petrotogales bacterium]
MKKIVLISIIAVFLTASVSSAIQYVDNKNDDPTIELFDIRGEQFANKGWDLDNNDINVDFEINDNDEDTIDLFFIYGLGRLPPNPSTTRFFGKIDNINSENYEQYNFDLNWIYTSHWDDFKGEVFVKVVAWDGQSYSNVVCKSLKNGIDGTNPSSTINEIEEYEIHSSPLKITVDAFDALSNVDKVSLQYSYSPDYNSWTRIQEFRLDDEKPWEFYFNFPYGEGYYRFYSSSYDYAGNCKPASQIEEEVLFTNQSQKI